MYSFITRLKPLQLCKQQFKLISVNVSILAIEVTVGTLTSIHKSSPETENLNASN